MTTPRSRARLYSMAAVPALALGLVAQGDGHTHAPARAQVHRKAPWSARALELAARIPVQHRGRIKPMHTVASYMLLRFHQKRSFKRELPDGSHERLGPAAWILDCLFFPDQARGYRHFTVSDDAVLTAIDVSLEGRNRRDRYSYDELTPGRGRLFQIARRYDAIDSKLRSSLQSQVLALASNVVEFERVMGFLEFAHDPIETKGSERLVELAGGQAHATLSVLCAQGPRTQALVESARGATGDEAKTLAAAKRLIDFTRHWGGFLALFPPTVSVDERKEWLSPADASELSLAGQPVGLEAVPLIAALEESFAAREDPVAFEQALAGFVDLSATRAAARGELAKIDLEVAYHEGDWLFKAQWVYILAFLLVAISWLWPKRLLVRWGIPLVTLVGLGMHTYAIWQRCILRGRPPVSTLYETIIFIAGCIVLVGLAMEFMNRRRIGQALAALLGGLGLWFASIYEVSGGEDTMPRLTAVLDTNFWLATHVTTITIGYAAGLLAAAIGQVYLLGKLFRWRTDDKPFYKSIARSVYGVLCFGLFFSLVGTILGGIWANDSWGRFWGWDPKENGALLICLSQLAILHGRMGGYLKSFGVCLTAVLAGTVVAFSWWHVNELGEGLHSYGFTEGVKFKLWCFYISQWFIGGLGVFAWFRDEAAATRARSMAPPLPTKGSETAPVEG